MKKTRSSREAPWEKAIDGGLPCAVDGLPIEEYHIRPGFSKSGLATILDKSPAHYLYELEHSQETALQLAGQVTHTLLLEPATFDARFRVMPDRIRRATRETAYREQIAAANGLDYVPDKEEAEELLRAGTGRRLVKHKELEGPRAAAEAAKGSPFWKRVIERSATVAFERSLLWVDDRWPHIELRSRPDVLLEYGGELYAVDIKQTGDAGASGFGRAAARFHYGLQTFLFEEATEAVYGVRCKTVMLAIDDSPPFAVEPWLVGTGPRPSDWATLGRAEYERAMEVASTCLQRNYWPTRLNGLVTALPVPRWLERDLTEAINAAPVARVEDE